MITRLRLEGSSADPQVGCHRTAASTTRPINQYKRSSAACHTTKVKEPQKTLPYTKAEKKENPVNFYSKEPRSLV